MQNTMQSNGDDGQRALHLLIDRLARSIDSCQIRAAVGKKTEFVVGCLFVASCLLEEICCGSMAADFFLRFLVLVLGNDYGV